MTGRPPASTIEPVVPAPSENAAEGESALSSSASGMPSPSRSDAAALPPQSGEVSGVPTVWERLRRTPLPSVLSAKISNRESHSGSAPHRVLPT